MRFFYFENDDDQWIKTLSLGFANSIFLSLFGFGKEIYLRKIHFEIKKFENSLSLYEKLIRDIIPISVIIWDNVDDISFYNRETLKIFNLNEEEEMKTIFKGTKIQEISKIDVGSRESNHNNQINVDRNYKQNLLDIIKIMNPSDNVFSCKVIKPGLNSERNFIFDGIKFSKLDCEMYILPELNAAFAGSMLRILNFD